MLVCAPASLQSLQNCEFLISHRLPVLIIRLENALYWVNSAHAPSVDTVFWPKSPKTHAPLLTRKARSSALTTKHLIDLSAGLKAFLLGLHGGKDLGSELTIVNRMKDGLAI